MSVKYHNCQVILIQRVFVFTLDKTVLQFSVFGRSETLNFGSTRALKGMTAGNATHLMKDAPRRALGRC
jgi:hypothetical protein